jgi:hypothetical protein
MSVLASLGEGIQRNNHAAELFEEEDLCGAVEAFVDALGCFGRTRDPALHELIAAPNLLSLATLGIAESWSKESETLAAPEEDDVFLHARVVLLSTDSIDPANLCHYVAVVLYNFAVSFHLCAMEEGNLKKMAEVQNLYSMALRVTPISDLRVYLFNNLGCLLYQEGLTYDATRYFQSTHYLLSETCLVPSHQTRVGLYLNSLMNTYTASAA